MSMIVTKLQKQLQSAKNYDEIYRVLTILQKENLTESFTPEILSAIKNTTLDADSIDVMKFLTLWVSTTKFDPKSSIELLTELCNRYVDDFDGLMFTPTSYELIICFLCCRDKEKLISRLTDEQIEAMGSKIATHIFKLDVEEDLNSNILGKTIKTYVDGNIDHNQDTNDDQEIRGEPSEIYRNGIISILNGENLQEHLFSICQDDFMNEIHDAVEDFTTRLCATSNIQKPALDNYMYHVIYALIETVRNVGQAKIEGPNYFMGRLLLNLREYSRRLTEMHGGILMQTQLGRLYPTINSMALEIFHRFYNCPSALLNYISQHFFHGNDNFMSEELLSDDNLMSLKMYLTEDPAFRYLRDSMINYEFNGSRALLISNDPTSFLTLLYAYEDPDTAYSDVTEARQAASSYATREEELDERTRELEERERELDEREAQLSSREDGDEERHYNRDDYDEPQDEDQIPRRRDSNITAVQSNKGYDKSSKRVAKMNRGIYGAFKKFKTNEQKVESQMDKMLNAAKRAFSGDNTEAIIQGKTWTPMSLLKTILVSGGIFSFSKIGGFLYLITSFYLKHKRTAKQKREILGELDTEIKILEEKIDDARGDANRQAKYALMRTKGELERARDKIRYNLNATQDDMETAKNVLMGKRSPNARNRGERYREEY